MLTSRTKKALTALNIGLAIILGAFGAHGLEGRTPPDKIQAFETGVLYHLLMGVVLLFSTYKTDWPKWFFRLLLSGSWLFSFSIYLLVGIPLLFKGVNPLWLGPVTPLGGVLMITAWVVLAYRLWKQ